MGRLRQRASVLQTVAMKMLEEGKPLNRREYDMCGKVPVKSTEVLRHFSSWTRMLNILQTDLPDIWAQLEQKQVKASKKEDPLAKLAASSKAVKRSEEMVHET